MILPMQASTPFAAGQGELTPDSTAGGLVVGVVGNAMPDSIGSSDRSG